MPIRPENKKRYPLFSNGTEFMEWQSHNCEKCVKAVFYNEKKDFYPKYRCAIQKHIEEACIGDGFGSKKVYDACRSYECQYKRTERKIYPKRKKDKSLELFKED